MKNFNLEDKNILSRLEQRYNTHVMYNILTYNFIYEINGSRKHISLKSLINFMEHENEPDTELLYVLKRIHDSYFPRRFKDCILEFYHDNNLTVPRNLFIQHGYILFGYNGESYQVKYHDDFELILNELNNIIKTY